MSEPRLLPRERSVTAGPQPGPVSREPHPLRRPAIVVLGGLTLLAAGCAAPPAVRAPAPAGDSVVMRLAGVPPGTPADAVVFLAGSFNQWNPADSVSRLTRRPDGSYAITLPLPAEMRGQRIEFKLTRGSWDAVETDAAGRDVENRALVLPATGSVVHDMEVTAWRDPSVPRSAVSTATASVGVLSDSFPMPQLGRARRVWVYLPPDYETSGRRYPVLYMHDGQNLFDAATSYAGEWGVDETLDSLHARGVEVPIVVGVEHGGARRFDEYSPWRHAQHGGGEGDAYVDFLVRTLKPHVDARYRTRPDAASTVVAGSSMGGLISLYAALKHPEVFGAAGVFSPALWVAPEVFDHAAALDARRPRPRLYFVSGALEGATPRRYVLDQARMVETLAAAGFREGAELQAHVREDGTHTEGFWRREFPAAFRWLFAPQAR